MCTDASPFSLLLQALSKSKADIPQNTLKEIKAVEFKQSQMKRSPELYINRNESLLDPVTFDLEGRALHVPSMRLKGLLRFEPVQSKPLAVYLQMDILINEMQHIQTEFKVGEAAFVSLLITQFSSECKNQIRAIISASGNFGNVPLEQPVSAWVISWDSLDQWF